MSKGETIPDERAISSAEPAVRMMPVQEAAQRLDTLAALRKAIFKKEIHYGRLPGTRRDVLLLPGAEEILIAFGARPRYVELDKVQQGDLVFYRYGCEAVHVITDTIIGYGIGSCCSDEQDGWARKPMAHANSIDKRAQKRAAVQATLYMSGASAMFATDVQEASEGTKSTDAQRQFWGWAKDHKLPNDEIHRRLGVASLGGEVQRRVNAGEDRENVWQDLLQRLMEGVDTNGAITSREESPDA